MNTCQNRNGSLLILTVAHKEKKHEAIRLYKEGWTVVDIALHLGLAERSIYRWCKQYRDGDYPEKKVKLKKVELDSPDNEQAQKEYYPSKNWVDFATMLSLEHFSTQQGLRVKLAELLNNALEDEPDNSRKINNLSLAVNRCIESERLSANLDLLNVNRAVEVLEKNGYVAIKKELLDG